MIRNARAPADHGLSGLGLVMQLGGAVFGTITALVGLSSLVAAADAPGHGDEKLWLFLLTAFGVARSLVHRAAGSELIYGARGVPLTRLYVWIGLAHTALWVFYLKTELDAPNAAVMPMAVAVAAWPVTMGGVLWLGPLAKLEGAVAMPRDKGFDGLGCLMTVLGLCGLLYGLVMTLTLVEVSRGNRDSFEFLLFIAMMIMLVVRSALHVRAAYHTMTSRDLDHTTEAASRYGNAGVTTAVIAGGLFLVLAGKSGGNVFVATLTAGAITALLVAWPMAVRRFVTERRFVGDADPAARAQQSTDGGLSALGWLLLALGVLGVATSLPTAVWDGAGTRELSALPVLGGADLDGSPWWPVVVGVLQIWAAIEMCGASERARLSAIVYGVAASAITLYLSLPLLRHLDRLAGDGLADPGSVAALGSLALSLVVPGATLLLAARKPPPAVPDHLGRVFE